MTIDAQIKQPCVVAAKEQRSLPEAHRFASSVLANTSHYLNVALSSAHWQLKDLLVSSSYTGYYQDQAENENPTFYFPYKNRIFSFGYSSIMASDAKTNVHTKIINYSSIKFQSNPRCLKQLDGIVVTGGISSNYDLDTNPIGLHKGSFSLFNPINSVTENIQIGEFITNSVSINKLQSSDSSHYRSYLCNNDKFLYQFDITPARIIQSANPLYLKTALNHSILSNDNKTQIIVGDSSKIIVSHPMDNNPVPSLNNYDVIHTEGDCGFSTAFLPNSYQFVTCFQDGLALIFDLRNMTAPIHKIHSTRPRTQPGAFRVVKTSNYNTDLICISEHQGRIHLIDARNFNNHSVLMLPKYLYNIPPAISVSYKSEEYGGDENQGGDENDHREINNGLKMFGKYPLAVSGDENRDTSTQWYNQPILKDIDDFKDLAKFGGDLNLGYLESYRYLENKYRSYNGTYRVVNDINEGESNQMASLKIILQGTYDREGVLKKYQSQPHRSSLLTYCDSYPKQFRKRNCEDYSMDIDNEKDVNDEFNLEGRVDERKIEMRTVDDQWWNKEDEEDVKNYQDVWPWGKKIVKNNSMNDDECDECDEASVNNNVIMETPYRDPFFYIDSDIEINGLELANKKGKSTLCIGTKEGIIFWDVNDWKRKSFPSFGYA